VLVPRGQAQPVRDDCGRATDRGLCAAVQAWPVLQVLALVRGQLAAQSP
jgi:hypothetical protein